MAKQASEKDIKDLTSALNKLIARLDKDASERSAPRKRTVAETTRSELEFGTAAEAIERQKELNASTDEYKQKIIDIEKRKEKISELDQEIYATAERIQEIKEDENSTEKDLLESLEAQFKQLKANRKLLAEKVKETEAMRKKLSDVYDVLDSMKNPLTSISNSLKKAVDKRFKDYLDNNVNSATSLAGRFKSLAPVIGLAGLALGALFKRALHLNQEITDIQRKFGLSTENATHLHHAVADAALASQVLGATQDDYNKAFSELVGEYGMAAAENAKLLDSQVLLTKQIGMSADEASNFRGMAELTGKPVEEQLLQIKDTVLTFNKLTGQSLSHREIQQEVAKVGKDIFAYYKGDVKQLTLAVMKTKQLGISMERAKSIADKLLDIESSLEAEMTASVMAGRSINLDRARGLAMEGKFADAAEAAVKAAGNYDQFLNENYATKKAIAEATGVEVEELVKAAELEKKRDKLHGKSFSQLTKAEIEQLTRQKTYSKEQIEQGIKDEQAISAQEKLAELKSKLLVIADKLVGPITKFVDLLVKGLNFITRIKNNIKDIVPPSLAEPLKKAGSVLGMSAALAGGITLFKGVAGFFAKAMTTGAMPVTVVNGGGAGTGGGGEGGPDLEKLGKGGLMKGMKRIGKAFKGGGVKGAGKALMRMGKGGLKGAMKGAKGLFKGGGKGLLKGIGKKIPYLGALLTTGMNIADEGLNWKSLARSGLELGGGALGGILGSMAAPGVGTMAGGMAGGMAGSWLANKLLGEAGEGEGIEEHNDVLIRPGQPAVAFNENDLIVGTKSGMQSGGGAPAGGNKEIADLLKVLIAKVDQPVRFSIGGRIIDEIETVTSLRKGYVSKTDSAYGALG